MCVVEQAVATSTVYLIRSMGTIYGVTITSAIVQNVLATKLPLALGDIENKDEVSVPREWCSSSPMLIGVDHRENQAVRLCHR